MLFVNILTGGGGGGSFPGSGSGNSLGGLGGSSGGTSGGVGTGPSGPSPVLTGSSTPAKRPREDLYPQQGAFPPLSAPSLGEPKPKVLFSIYIIYVLVTHLAKGRET